MIITYQNIEDDCCDFSYKIDGSIYNAICPIPSGGIAVGIILSRYLGIDKILSLKEYNEYLEKNKVLVIDDLADSGKTLSKFPNSDTAVLYRKPNAKKEPTYYFKDIPNEWVILPHEKDEIGIDEHLIRILEYYKQEPNQENLTKLKNFLKSKYV